MASASSSIGDVELTLGKEILHILKVQGEAHVEPDSMLDDRK
jgi:hypothetical protein